MKVADGSHAMKRACTRSQMDIGRAARKSKERSGLRIRAIAPVIDFILGDVCASSHFCLEYCRRWKEVPDILQCSFSDLR